MTNNEVTFRPRRQLLVTVQDGHETCTLRFFHFYASLQKVLAVGARVRMQYDRPWGTAPRLSQLVVIAEHHDVNEAAIRKVLGV